VDGCVGRLVVVEWMHIWLWVGGSVDVRMDVSVGE